jgi:lipopolysaccharide/colanic/teichoic acid biosynthesis glycosyltransferase
MANSSPKNFDPDIVAIAASCFVGFWASQKLISPVSSFEYRLGASAVALVVLAPVMLVAIAAIRIGGGSPLFKQQRVGVDGQLLSLWKIRTMPEGERPATPIDEIPQFVNALKGDKSVVGPRLRLPEEVKLSNMMSRRLRAKPGTTGLCQVSGRSLISLDEAEALDVDYVDTWSFVSDAVIILRTICVAISGRGAF